jgi:hypothetical protein
MTGETLTLLGAAVGGIFGAGGAFFIMRYRVNKNASDINGLGRKFWKSIAAQLRILAEDEPISKAKLLHLADFLEPK